MRRAPARGRLVSTLGLLGCACLLPAAPASAQRRDSPDTRLLREASALESRGDLAGAERVLRTMLHGEPTSSGGLFALERVLRAQGRTVQILPVIAAFLEHEPGSAGVRYLELRVLEEVDSLTALERRADAWLGLAPADAGPYREVARVYRRAFGPDRALEVLTAAREATGEPGALALEVGDLRASLGQVEAAVDEWTRAVLVEEGQAGPVARRLAELGAAHREPAARALLERLDDRGGVHGRRAGARIALELGMAEEARELAGSAAGALEGRERGAFLSEVARRAHEGGLAGVAAWAYRELGRGVADAAERRELDVRLVEVSLAAGDTAAALEAQRRVAASYASASVDRRRALARAIHLEAVREGPGRLRELLADFRDEFPGAPELDELAATLAGELQARGDADGAAAVLEGIEGPRSAVERGYLLLDAGEVEAGRGALLGALEGVPPEEATGLIQLAGLLERLSSQGRMLLAGAAVAAHRDRPDDAVRRLAEGVAALEPAERAPLLAEAARIAERAGLAERAAEVRARILAGHPDAPEVEEASLALARHRARSPDGVADAIRILEALITQRPNAAVVPDARLELERLRGRGGGP